MAYIMMAVAVTSIIASSFFLLSKPSAKRRGSFGVDNVAAVVGMAGVVLGIVLLVVGAATL